MADNNTDDNEDPDQKRAPSIPSSASVVLGDGEVVVQASGEDFESVTNFCAQEARYWMNKSNMVIVDEADRIDQHIHREGKDW